MSRALRRRLVRAISLFSGAGGFELGLERAGIETVIQAEINPAARGVLERHWPECRRVDDVRLVATTHPFAACPPECEEGCTRDDLECVGIQEVLDDYGPIDLIFGGFPCQDISAARGRWGATGLSGDRSGLWYEFLRTVELIRPRWALVENVERLRSGRGGADFAAIVEGFRGSDYVGLAAVLDAAAFGLPASRPRVFIVARDARDPRGVSDLERLAAGFLDNDRGRFLREGPRQSLATDRDSAPRRPAPGSYRLLTPREAERCLGWPEDHTRYTASGRELPPGVRYRLIGNGVAAPVAEWIGRRIVEASS